MVVARCSDDDHLSEDFTDVTLEDLRRVADFFAIQGNLILEEGYSRERVIGVKVSCDGEVQQSGEPRFAFISTPINAPLFQDTVHDKPLTVLLGLPLRAATLAAESQATIDFSLAGALHNQSADFLNILCTPDMSRWRWFRSDKRRDRGTVILVRQDKNLLRPQHIEAFTELCNSRLRPLFEASTSPSGEVSKEKVLQVVNPESFKEFFETLRSQKIRQGHADWVQVSFPD